MPEALSGFTCPVCSQELTTVVWQFSKIDKRVSLLCINCNVNHGPRDDFDDS